MKVKEVMPVEGFRDSIIKFLESRGAKVELTTVGYKVTEPVTIIYRTPADLVNHVAEIQLGEKIDSEHAKSIASHAKQVREELCKKHDEMWSEVELHDYNLVLE